MSGVVIGSPLDRATRGYFCGPIGRATHGHFCFSADVIDKPVSGGTNRPPGPFPYRDHFGELDSMDQLSKLERIKVQKREDEEILLIIKLFVKCQ